ncbi:helix-turn-helix domain-containing protein [Spirosoma arcticum]
MDAMLYKGQFANLALREFIHHYEVVRFVFGRDVPPPAKYHTPRPEQSLTFYPRDPQRFSYTDSTEVITYPHAIVNGVHTTPTHRYGGHDFLAIRIIFQPGALFRLTGLPSGELTNTFVDAEAIWPKAVRPVSEWLNSTDDLTEMLTIVEAFLSGLFQSFRKHHHAIDATSRLIVGQQHRFSLDHLADQSCLSIRQFIRKFEERIGLSPKQFDRIARFDRAYRMRNQYPSLDWLSVAIACGYYDHQHFAKDCKELTYLSPISFFAQNQKAPEFALGLPGE